SLLFNVMPTDVSRRRFIHSTYADGALNRLLTWLLMHASWSNGVSKNMATRAHHDQPRYLRAPPETWAPVDLATWKMGAEMWTPIWHNDGSVSYLSVHGKYLSSNGDGKVYS
ncbi:hypothetical protein PMAYCL1PPCAC_32085, partial [Pristionchus mayeri]